MSVAPGPSPSPGSDPSERLATALRTAHRSTLGLLAACAVVSALQRAAPDAVASRAFTYTAIGLAVATVGCRRMSTSAVLGLRARVLYAAITLAAASALGLTAASMAVTQGTKQSALVIVLAAVVLVLRPPALAQGSRTSTGTRKE